MKKPDIILIVDDEMLITEILAKIVSRINYRSHICINGREAVDYYRKNGDEVALIILDMIMPEMNGYETFNAIRNMDPSAKILIVSGYALEEDAAYMQKKGAVGFIEKPFHSEQLISVVEKILK